MKVPSELNLFLTFLDHITLKNFQILPTENHRRDLDSCGMWGGGRSFSYDNSGWLDFCQFTSLGYKFLKCVFSA